MTKEIVQSVKCGEHRDLSLDLKKPCKNPGATAHTCHPALGREVLTTGSLGLLVNQSGRISKFQVQ